MKHKLILEENIDLEEDITDAMGTHEVNIGGKKVQAYGDMFGDSIEEVLDDFLRINEEALESGDYEDVENLLIIGKGGTGKTSQVRAWARKNDLNVLFFNGSQLRKDTMQGPPHAQKDTITLDDGTEKEVDVSKRLSPSDFKPLDRPRSVFIIDELNRSMAIDRGSILEMIEDRTLPDDNYPEGRKPLKNLLMTVAMMNPSNRSYAGAEPLDDAMLGRYTPYLAESSTEKVTEHIINKYNNLIKNVEEKCGNGEMTPERRDYFIKKFTNIKQIAKLVMKAGIEITTSDEDMALLNKEGKGSLSNRTYTKALKASEGNPDKFLRLIASNAGLSENPSNLDDPELPTNIKKLADYNDTLQQFKYALSGFVDSDTVENSFKKESSTLWDKVFDYFTGNN